jgi:hypothetical protein
MWGRHKQCSQTEAGVVMPWSVDDISALPAHEPSVADYIVI